MFDLVAYFKEWRCAFGVRRACYARKSSPENRARWWHDRCRFPGWSAPGSRGTL